MLFVMGILLCGCLYSSHFFKFYSKKEQHITICCSVFGNFERVYFTLVYANVFYSQKRFLWSSMVHLSSSLLEPWVSIGDFNAILGLDEKTGPFSCKIFCRNSRRQL